MTETIVIVSGAGEQGPPGPPSLSVGAVVTGRGQIPVGNAAGTPVALPAGAGTAGQFLKGGLDPAYANIAEADVTNLTTDLAAKAPLASPTFTGTVTAAAVTATGDVTLGDADADLTTVRRLRRKGVKPTIAATPVATYPGAGGDATAPTVTNNGTDGAGVVRVTLGTAPGAGDLFKLTFSSVKPDTNYGVQITPTSTAARQRQYSVTNKTTAGFNVSINTGGTIGDQVDFFYQVLEWEEV